MSKIVDERVVEMRFDNAHFEKNVQTSMSTIEKLKQKLNFTGASKGLDNINASVKRVDMSGLGRSVDGVQVKFNALWTIADQTMRNITNSVERAAKRMVSALTIDPIKTGFQEYETQINAVQTILANTSHAGTDIEDVNKALDELNLYADKTIYNFTEMTRNIGTFTAAGLGLEESTMAIKGIANLAAVSGSTSQQASTAMYQLSQALANGKVNLQDWNSVVNAGMGGKVFQDALVRTAAAMKGVTEETFRAQNITGSFRESISSRDGGGWLTADVLSKTLQQFTGDMTDAELASMGFTEAQIKNIQSMARTANEAATKVKTLTQLWDVMKESAQSGWAQTWKILVGDFEEAKALLTPIADFFTGENGIITKFSNARNELLESALGRNFKSLSDKVKTLTKPIQKSADAVKDVVKSVGEYAEVIDDIIGGKWGNGQERFDKLAEAGFDWAHAQNLVNEKLGDATRHATDYKEAQEGAAKAQGESNEAQKALNESTAKRIAQLATEEESTLRAKGYTEEQIKAFRELAEAADKTGIPLEEFIKNIDQIDGKYLLVNSLKNAGQGLVKVFTAIGKAYRDAFPAMQSEQLFDIIAGMHKFSTYLNISDDTVDKLTRTFKGLFAIVDIATTILGGGFKIAFKVLSEVLGYFDLNILDVTASIGDAIAGFRDWFDSVLDISKILDIIVPALKTGMDIVKGWIDSFLQIERVQEAINNIKNAFSDLKDLDFNELGVYVIEGLVKGLASGTATVIKSIVTLAKELITHFCAVMGIHSPSQVMYDFGQFIVQGLVNGIAAGVSWAINGVKDLGHSIVDAFKSIDVPDEFVNNIKSAFDKFVSFLKEFDYKKLLAIIPIGVVLVVVKKIVDVTKALADGINGFNDVIEGFVDIEKAFTKILNGFALNLKAKALKQVAISIAILVGSLIALTFIDTGKLYNAVGVIFVLSAILVGLAFAMDKMSQTSLKFEKGKLDMDGIKSSLMSIGITMLLLAATVKLIGSMKPDQVRQGFISLTAIMLEVVAFVAACILINKLGSSEDIDKVGAMMRKIAVAMLIMAVVMKVIGGLSAGEIIKGTAFIAVFGLFTIALTDIAKGSDKHIGKVGGMMIKMAIAMGLMIGVMKMVNLLDLKDVVKGIAFAAGFTLFVGALVKVTQIGNDKKLAKVGWMVLSISSSMLLMLGMCKLAGMLSKEDMLKGAAFAGGFLLLVAALVQITKIGSDKQMAKVAGTILAFSVAIGILAGVAILLSMVDTEGLKKGVAAVSMLGIVMAAMVWATRGSSSVVGNLVVLTIAIGIMAAAVAVLSGIDGSKLAGATLAMTSVVGVFAVVLNASKNVGKAIPTLLILTAAVGLITGMLYMLAKLPMENTVGAAAALSMVLLSLSASMAILSKPMMFSPNALITMGVLTLIVGALGVILHCLQDLNPDTALPVAIGLSTLLLAMSGVCVILGAAGSFGVGGFIGIGVLMTLVIALGGLLIGIGKLAEHFPKMEEFLNKGIPILDKIGYALGSFFGNIVGGFSEGITSGLPAIGTNLSDFMTNLDGFITGAKKIDETALSGISSLVKMMGLMSGGAILEQVAQWITGESSMETFKTNLLGFGDAIVAFSNKMSGATLDESAITAAANAGRIMSELQSKVSMSGPVISFFANSNNLETFGSQLVAYGKAITEFSNTLTSNGGIDEAAVLAASNAGRIMANLQEKVSMTGPVVSWFTSNSLETFGSQLVAYGKAIVDFSYTLTSGAGINEEAVTAAANAGAIMSELQSKLSMTGPVVSWFNSNSLETFGTQLAAYGRAIVDFSYALTSGAGIDEVAVTAAANAGRIMSELQSKISLTGPVVSFFSSSNNLATFGTQIKAYGDAIAAFSAAVYGKVDEGAVAAAANTGRVMAELQKALPEDKWFDGKISIDDFGYNVQSFGYAIVGFSNTVAAVNVDAVENAINASYKLVNLSIRLASVDPESVKNFKIGSIGSAINTYYSNISEVDFSVVASSISAANRLCNFINSLSGLDSSGVSTYQTAIDNLGKVNLDGFIKAFSGSSANLSNIGSNMMSSLIKGINSRRPQLTSTAKQLAEIMVNAIKAKTNAFGTAGMHLIHKLTQGVTSRRVAVKNSVTLIVNGAVSGIRGCYNSFYNAGSYLVDGFVAGIDENAFKAKATAVAMAKAALQAAEEALGIASPSKEFYKVGDYAGQGFVKALSDYERISYKAAGGMAESARGGISDAIRRINSLINTDMDMQPTIRPVLDLSDVKANAGSISSLFNARPSVGVMANVGVISSNMNGGIQNGNNSDVVSAIKDLKREIGRMPGNTTIIDGITYDDGSNITTTVEALVRAAKMERRV